MGKVIDIDTCPDCGGKGCHEDEVQAARFKRKGMIEVNSPWSEADALEAHKDSTNSRKPQHDELCPRASVTLYDEEYHPECTCPLTNKRPKL